MGFPTVTHYTQHDHSAMGRLVDWLYWTTHHPEHSFTYYHAKDIADKFPLFREKLMQHAISTASEQYSPFELQRMMGHLEQCASKHLVRLPALPRFMPPEAPVTTITQRFYQATLALSSAIGRLG